MVGGREGGLVRVSIGWLGKIGWSWGQGYLIKVIMSYQEV